MGRDQEKDPQRPAQVPYHVRRLSITPTALVRVDPQTQTTSARGVGYGEGKGRRRSWWPPARGIVPSPESQAPRQLPHGTCPQPDRLSD